MFAIANNPLLVEIGDLTVTLRKLTHEWQLNYYWQTRGNDGAYDCRYLESDLDTPHQIDRIAMEAMADGIMLLPRLAPMPIVVRPYSPFILPANNSVTLYVTTPIWLTINFGQGVDRELPVQRLSETWMGPQTHEGELCFGSHTHARLDRDLLLKRPWRALTPVTIHNRCPSEFTLERLSIPAPYLSLHQRDDQLVTEALTMTLESENHRGIVNIEKIIDGEFITGPRKAAEKGVLVRTWENLFA